MDNVKKSCLECKYSKYINELKENFCICPTVETLAQKVNFNPVYGVYEGWSGRLLDCKFFRMSNHRDACQPVGLWFDDGSFCCGETLKNPFENHVKEKMCVACNHVYYFSPADEFKCVYQGFQTDMKYRPTSIIDGDRFSWASDGRLMQECTGKYFEPKKL